ncbi:MAG: hypothetical protein ACYC35_04240 [Pirellulales bacterium]
MPKTKIILLCTVAAVVYGIVHDQITARVCIEYFTIAHPPLFRTTSPTLLAVCWGIVATFWVGLLLGVVLVQVSQSAGAPGVPIARIGALVAALLVTMAMAASLAGILGFELSRRSHIAIPAYLARVILESRHDRFMAVWFAHGASYLVGLAGSALLIFRIWTERGRPRVIAAFPRTKLEVVRAVALVALTALIAWFRFFRGGG